MGFWSFVGTTSNHKQYDVCNKKRQIPVLLSILGWDKTGDHFRLEAVAACLCDTCCTININLGERPLWILLFIQLCLQNILRIRPIVFWDLGGRNAWHVFVWQLWSQERVHCAALTIPGVMWTAVY